VSLIRKSVPESGRPGTLLQPFTGVFLIGMLTSVAGKKVESAIVGRNIRRIRTNKEWNQSAHVPLFGFLARPDRSPRRNSF